MSLTADDRWSQYAAQLPGIYREILAAFPRMEPGRRAGYGLAFGTLAADFEERRLPFTLGEIIAASEQLQSNGLVEVKHQIFVHPTARGERLIHAITGHESPETTVPPLPPPPASEE